MSTLKVGTIQDHANSNTAISIDSGGRPILSGQPCVAVECSNASRFGTSHSSTTYDTNYKTPIPLFTSGTTTTLVNRGGMTLTFPSHPIGSGNYCRIQVPVTGVYEYHFTCGGHNVATSDWFVLGLEKNSAAESSSDNLSFGGMNFQMNNASDQQDTIYFNGNHSIICSLDANDFVVQYGQSVQDIGLVGMSGGKFALVMKQIA